MKRTISAMLAALVCAVACTTTGPVSEPKLNVDGLSLGAGNEVVVPAAGLDVTFSITSNLGYTVTSSQSWATVTPAAVSNEDGKDVKTAVTVAVEANETAEAREAVIKVVTEKNPALDYSFTVKQSAGKEPVSFYVTTTDLKEITAPIEVAEKATSASVIVVSNVSWTASSDQTWLTVSPASATIENEEVPTTVSFAVEANSVTEVRTATVTFTAEGAEPVVVSVSQAAKKDVSFTITVENVTYKSADITCVPSDETAYFLLSCETASYVDQFTTDADLINADMEYFYKEYGESYAEYKFESYEQLFLKGLCSVGTKEWTPSPLDPETEYVVYAFAVDAELNPITSTVPKVRFTTEAKPVENWNFYGKGKYTEGYLSGLFGLDAKQVEVDIYQDPNNENRFAMFNAYGPEMLVNWMFNESVTIEQIEAAKGQIWDDTYYSYTIDFTTGEVVMPVQPLGVIHSKFGAIEAGIDPEYDPNGTYADGVVTLQVKGATVYLPNGAETSNGTTYYFYGNTNGAFKIEMPTSAQSSAASKSVKPGRITGLKNYSVDLSKCIKTPNLVEVRK